MSAAIELAPELDAALRAELRAGEVVAYARSPLSMHEDGPWSARLVWAFMALGPIVAAGTLVKALLATAEVVSGARPLDWDFAVLLLGAFFLSLAGWGDAWRIARDRRRSRRSAVVVTNQRILIVHTWPARSVLAWEGNEIRQCVRTPHTTRCGHVRFLDGLYSNEQNALMRVPDPHACAAAVGALLAAQSTRVRTDTEAAVDAL
ncbi:MAG: hypothetical protein NTU45_07505 [Planctomycetota bacterium]|nr:hypothetical protein [Planctomycetota bacterium]